MRRVIGVFVCVLLVAACSSKKDESQTAASAPAAVPNQRRVDSAIARSGIPMTSAIGKAMGAADAASAQAAAHDSVLNNMK